MAECSHLAPNGEKSILYQQLEDFYGPAIAHDLWERVRSQQFLNKHGDWMAKRRKKDAKDIPLDANREPTFEWADNIIAADFLVEREQQKPPEKEVISKEFGSTDTKRRTNESDILAQVQATYLEATTNTDKIYHIPYEYVGERYKYPNKYTARELADIFNRAGDIPPNVTFTPGFRTLMNNTTDAIIKSFPTGTVDLINREEPAVLKAAGRMLIQKTDGSHYTASQQKEIVDSLVKMVEGLYRRDKSLKGNAVVKAFALFQAQNKALTAKNDPRATDYQAIYDNRGKLAESVVNQLRALGLYVDEKGLNKIYDSVIRMMPDIEMEKVNMESSAAAVAEQTELDPETLFDEGDFLETTGRITRDWSENSFELNPRDTASARIKMFMGTQADMDKATFVGREGGEHVTLPFKTGSNVTADLSKFSASAPQQAYKFAKNLNRKPFWYNNEKDTEALQDWLRNNYAGFQKNNFMGLPKTADYQQLFQDTMNLLGNRKAGSTFEEFQGLMKTSGNPTIASMADQLEKESQQMKNEFMTVMMKQYQRFLTGVFDMKDENGNTVFTHKIFNSNRYNQLDTLIKQFQQNQKLSEITILSPSGERVLDADRIRTRWIPILDRLRKVNDWGTPESRDMFVDWLGQILNLSGIPVTDEMMTDMYQNPAKWTGTPSIASLFHINPSTGAPEGMFSIFIMRSAGMITDTAPDAVDKNTSLRMGEVHNPLYSEKTIMTKLAALVAKYTPVLYSSNHLNGENKNVYDWGMNTKLSNEFRDFTTNFAEVSDKLSRTDIAKNNWLVDYIKNDPAALGRMELNYLDTLRAEWAKKGSTRQKMSDREQMLTSLLLFQNRGNSLNKSPRVGYMSLTHADKTTTPVFHNMPKVPAGRSGVMPATIIGRMDSLLYNVFKSEYDRIVKQGDISFNNKKYDNGKKLFYYIPHFNYDGMMELVNNGVITREEMQYIYPAGERRLTKIIDSERELPVINKVLSFFAGELINNTKTAWLAEGIIGEKSTMFDNTYAKGLMRLNGIREQTKEGKTYLEVVTGINNTWLNEQGQPLTREQVNEIIADTGAKDYAINQFFFNVSMSQIFYGDPAEAFKKSKTDRTDMDYVKTTMADYTKRLAKDIAPHSDLYWQPSKKYYNSITLKDVQMNEAYLKDITNLAAAYNSSDIDSTDAQELITVQEHLDVLDAMGRIDDQVYEEMSKIIADAGPGGYYEFTKPEHLEIVFQPMKPVYAAKREPFNGAMLTDYVKSSAYPLYPPLTRYREIDFLRNLMEVHNIQRANYDSARKLGSPTAPVVVFNNQGKFVQPKLEEIKAGTSVLDRTGFGIQQDNPYDLQKEAIKILTQMNENLVEGITQLDGFMLNGESMTGKQIKAAKEDVKKRMIDYNFRKLLAQFDKTDEDLLDIGSILDKLVDEAQRDRTNQYTMNEIQGLRIRDKDGNTMIPVMFSASADRVEKMLMSMVNSISQLEMPGKSYIQASSTGMRISENTDLSKVIRIGNWDGSPLKTMRIEDGVVKPGQIIVPFNFFDAAGNKMQVKDFLLPDTNQLDLQRVPPELLELVGGRVPNQSHSSMIALEIVGFTPDNMGDIALVPAAIVKQMGADFDVDKLYTYKRPYKYDPIMKSFNATVTDRMPKMQQEYFDIHWSILTNPAMLEKILRPLDKDDLKNESQKLDKKASPFSSYFDPMSQLEDFQRGKSAKRLVGQSSWAVKMNARIQDKDLILVRSEMGEDGKPRLVQDTIEVLDEHTGDLRVLKRLSGNGKSYYTAKDGFPPAIEDVRSKNDNHIMVQSEAVDNTKNRTLDPLNLTSDTYKAVQALIQLEDGQSWAMNSKYWTRLLTQPIIQEYSKEMRKGNDGLSQSYTANLHNAVMESLRNKYTREIQPLGELSQDQKDKVDSIRFSPQTLLKAQEMEPSSEAYTLNQLAVLELYGRMYGIGDRLFQIESYLNQDVGGAGPSLIAAMDKTEKVAKINIAPIGEAHTLTTNGTEVGSTFNTLTAAAEMVTNRVLPYNNLSPMFTQLQEYIGSTQLSSDQQKAVLKAIRSSGYSSATGWWSNPRAERVRLFYGEHSLAKRLANAKLTWGIGNPLLARLATAIGANNSSADYIQYQAVNKSLGTDKEVMSAAWLELLMSSDETQRRLGEDLARYSMLTGGIQDATSFSEFLPNSWLAGTEMSGTLKDLEMEIRDAQNGYLNSGLLIQLMQHYPEFAPKVPTELFGKLEQDREYPETFRVPEPSEDNFNKFEVLRNAITEEHSDFVAYRSRREGKWVLYKKTFAGNGIFYVRMDTLGNQYSDEYDATADSGIRSIFAENRAIADSLPGTTGLEDLQQTKLNAFTLGNFNTGITAYDQIGVNQGGADEAWNGMNVIRQNKELNQSLRETAEFLMGTWEAAEGRDAKAIINAHNSTFSLQWTTDAKAPAGISQFTNTVILNPRSVRNKHEAAEIFLHEMTHNRLQFMVAATGFDKSYGNLANKDLVAMVQKRIEDYRKKYPEIAEEVQALENIRYEALQHFRNELGEEAFQRVKAQIEAGIFQTEQHQLYYALSDTQELISHVMTDTGFQSYLNNIQSKNGNTILSRIWEKFLDMLTAVGKALGVQVKEGSLLKEALARTMKLASLQEARDIDITHAIVSGQEFRLPSENLMEQVQHLAAASYGKAVEIKHDALGWTGKMGPEARVRHAVTGQRGRILTEMYKQLDEVKEVLNRPKLDVKERVKLRARQREIYAQITNLHQTNNINVIADIGKRQLQWVDEVLHSPHGNTVDVNMAINTAHIWESLLDILYGDLKDVTDISDEFSRLQAEGVKRMIELRNKKAPQVLTKFFKGDVQLTPLDYKEKLTDVGGIEAATLAGSRLKPLLVQATSTFTWREANNRDEHFVRTIKQLEALEKKMKDAGLMSQMMIQQYEGEDGQKEWGLVNRLSAEWYSDLSEMRDRKESNLESIDKTQNLTPQQRTEKRKAIWQKYWDDMKSKAVVVDIRNFLDVGTGLRLNTPESKAALDKLTEAVGSEHYAKELLQKAEERYDDYLTEREAMRQHLEVSIRLSEEDKAGKSAEEQEVALQAIRDQEMTNWLKFNSPVELLTQLDKKNIDWMSDADRWLEVTAKKGLTSYYDDRYAAIEKDPKKLAVYNEYSSVLTEMISYLPMEVQRKLPDNFLPIVPKDSASWLTGVLSKIRNWDTEMLKAVAATDWEEASRLRPDKIPVMYVNPRGATKDIDGRSQDVIRILEMFSLMALQHRYMGNVLETINIAENVIKGVNARRLSGQDPGKVLENVPKVLKYLKDATVFMKPKELEGKINTPLYSLNLAKQHKIEKEVKALIKEKEELQKQIEEKFVQGDFDTKVEDDRLEEVDKQLTKLEADARNIFGSKFADALISINQMKALAWNPFSAIPNLSFALVSIHIYAKGKIDFSPADANAAFGVMTHSMKKYWMFNDDGDPVAQKVHNLMARAGIMGESVDTDFGKSNLPSHQSKVGKALSPFNWLRAGDYFTKGMLMVSMMKSKTIEVTEKGTGNKITIPLWEAYNSAGTFDTDKYEPQENWYSADIHEQTDWNRFRDKMRKVSMLVYGNQDRNMPLMAKKNWFWRLAGQFRMSWFPEGIATRFKAEYYDINLERAIKGRWSTYKDLGILNSGVVLAKQMIAALPGVKSNPFNGTTMKNGKPLEDSVIDMENMRKNFSGLAWTVAFMATIMALRALGSGKHKKDDDDRRRQLLINLLTRNYQDLMLYSSPGVFNTISGNFLPATQVIVDYLNAVQATGHYLFANDPKEKHAFKKWFKKITRAGLPHPVATQYNKWETMLTRDIDKLQR